uniref:Uncharacterized protein n=1 Tax=Lepeophtheirus salmonis TaxID=72036 RepID=A0A0K2V002_LEPSM
MICKSVHMIKCECILHTVIYNTIQYYTWVEQSRLIVCPVWKYQRKIFAIFTFLLHVREKLVESDH